VFVRRSIHVAGLAHAGLALLAFGAAPAAALDYPTRPITLIVSHVPGGPSDVIARVLSSMLAPVLRQPLVIENRPGAGGSLAWSYVAAAEPDGYTLMLAENALAISQALYKKSRSSFDPVTQYDAVTGIAVSPSALVPP